MEYRDQTLENQEVLLDGNTFTGCTFRNCVMIFGGTNACTLGANHFKENVQWVLDGAAGTTIQFLSAIYNSGGKGSQEFVEQIFEQIRRGFLPRKDVGGSGN